MNPSNRIAAIFAAGLSIALLLSAPGWSQTTAGEKEKEKAAAKARENAKVFEENATRIILYDRQGKFFGSAGEPGLYDAAVLSPDRTRIAVVKEDLDAENQDLWVLNIAGGKLTRITTSLKDEYVQSPVWSPDGRELAYVQIRRGTEGLYSRDAGGEGPEELLYKNAGIGLGLSDWSLDGRFLTFTKSERNSGTLYILPAGGSGEREPKEVLHSMMPLSGPRFSPDGGFLSYLSQNLVFIRPIDGTDGPWQASEGNARDAWWRSDGKELYYVSQDGTVMVDQISTSPSVTVSRPKLLFQPPGVPPVSMLSISSDGERFLALPPPREPRLQQITLYDRRGKVVGKVGSPGSYNGPVFSPDGRRLAVMKGADIWTFDLASGKGTPVTLDGGFKSVPVWSPDGKFVLYSASRIDRFGVYRRAADGTGDEELLFQYTPGAGIVLTDISPDGRFLACASGGVILVVPLTGSDPSQRTAIEFLREEFYAGSGRFSPDGRSLAYVSNELDPDREEVWVRAFDPATGKPAQGKWQLSKEGAADLEFWRADGKEFLYRRFVEPGSDELVVMSAGVRTTPTFEAQTPKVLFTLPGPLRGNLGAISPDGQQFAFAVEVPGAKSH